MLAVPWCRTVGFLDSFWESLWTVALFCDRQAEAVQHRALLSQALPEVFVHHRSSRCSRAGARPQLLGTLRGVSKPHTEGGRDGA